jgi:hypothetical protein
MCTNMLRTIVPTGWTQTTPASVTIPLGPNQTAGGALFGTKKI